MRLRLRKNSSVNEIREDDISSTNTKKGELSDKLPKDKIMNFHNCLIMFFCASAVVMGASSTDCLAIFTQTAIINLIVLIPGCFFLLYSFTFGNGIIMCLFGLRGLASVSQMRFESKTSSVNISNWKDLNNLYKIGRLNQKTYLNQLITAGPEGLLWCIVVLQATLYLIYGLRFLFFFSLRSFSKSYRRYRASYLAYAARGKDNISQRCFIVLFMSLFTAWLYIPLYYSLINLEAHVKKDFSKETDSFGNFKTLNGGWCKKGIVLAQLLGVFVAFKGIIIEQIADIQKLRFKEYGSHNKTRQGQKEKLCTIGLYKYTQHPNYLGETVFHFGMILVALAGFGWNYKYWLMGAGVHISMILTMMEATARLQTIQKTKYQGQIEYENYIKKTPVFGFLVLECLKDFLGIFNISNTKSSRRRTK